MKKYKVGQILYLIGNNSTKIMPIQVIEEVIRTTINGTEKTYTVQMPDKKNTKADIKKIKGIIFETKHNLKNHMLTNATSAINIMIKTCEEIANTVFMSKPENDDAIIDKDMQTINDDDIINVKLDDGNIAKFNPNNLEKVNAIN